MSTEWGWKFCLHGKTQNANASLNGLIWWQCAKTIFSGRKSVEIAVAIAVLHFNDGPTSINQILNRLGIEKGFYTVTGSE